MFGIAVHYLAGRCAASRHNDRDQPEWPPHPARLFSALVDAWAVGGERPEEAEALRWLERAGAPAIAASEARERAVHTHFVPVNDAILVGSHGDQARIQAAWDAVERARAALPRAEEGRPRKKAERELARLQKKLDGQLRRMRGHAARVEGNRAADVERARQLIPGGQVRQARTFPVVIPDHPEVVFSWEGRPTEAVRAALDALTGRVARLGHSSSLVSCRLVDAAPDPWLVPDPAGDRVLRVPLDGQLDLLVEAWRHHRGTESRLLPADMARYRVNRPQVDLPTSPLAGDWIVLRRQGGRRLPVTQAARVAGALRGAVLSFARDPIPEWISGHRPDGRPSEHPHVAWVPLPFVGHRHATGDLLGVAILLPHGRGPEDRVELLAALGRWREQGFRLHMGRAGSWTLVHEALEPRLDGLRRETWSGPSRAWATVTPVAVGRNPGNLHARDPEIAGKAADRAAVEIRGACARQGLPEPAEVHVTFQPLVTGVPPATRFPPFPTRKGPGRFRKVLVHAGLRFHEPIRGPLLLGAGRYLGLGLLRPAREER